MRIWADCGEPAWGSKPAPEGWKVSSDPLPLVIFADDQIEEISFDDWQAMTGPQHCEGTLETLVYWAALGETIRTGSRIMYRDRVPHVLSYHGDNARVRAAVARAQEAIEFALQQPAIGMLDNWKPPMNLWEENGNGPW